MNNFKISYSAVIPIFNEVDNIEPLYKRLKNVLESLGCLYEIIFVDDGSEDDSYGILKKISIEDKKVKVLSFKRNFGQHTAVVAGILEAEGSYIITLDADLQNPPEELPKLIDKIKEGFDMVSGYRKTRKDSFKRRFFSGIANAIIFSITGLAMKDYGSMLRVFNRETAKKLAKEFMRNQGYITMLVAKVTHNVAEVEVNHSQRYSGASKYNIYKLVSVFFRIFCYGRMIPKTNKLLFSISKKVEYGKESVVGF